MLGRKELFKNTLSKAAHAWKRIIELRLTGMLYLSFLALQNVHGRLKWSLSLSQNEIKKSGII